MALTARNQSQENQAFSAVAEPPEATFRCAEVPDQARPSRPTNSPFFINPSRFLHEAHGAAIYRGAIALPR